MSLNGQNPRLEGRRQLHPPKMLAKLCTGFKKLTQKIMRRGNLINSSGEAAEGTHKINVKGLGVNLNHRDTDGGTLLAHARRKETVRMLGSAIQGNQ